MRIVVIGDVGVLEDMVHVGDEAMFDELVHQMVARGISDITAVSSNPAETTERYGVDAVPNIGFRTQTSSAERNERMDLVLRTAAGDQGLLEPGDSAFAVIEAIRASDGVAISGGGNMASTWPSHIFERGTIGEIARLLGKPLVVSGQTIGPHLEGEDRDLVARLLSSAEFVGLRESDSYDLCLELGVPEELLNKTVDDASFLAERITETTDRSPYCLVSLSTHTGDQPRELFVEHTAALLDEIVATTGLEIIFFAHFGSLVEGEVRGDTVIHEQVAARMTSTTATVLPNHSVDAAALARGAELILSSRYHPAVFAVSGGVPTIGIPVDDYTTTKLTGALGNFGQRGLVPAAELVAGAGPAAASAVWNDRAAIRSRGLEIAAAKRAESSAWWDRVAEAFVEGRD
ncbi:polysaccharide pyruvyl transferase WcaK-like protein [Conyzicola lurida]|uniref:Polysaccharide pyruvyl transferase WcaK-like protein n=1 Tax=Conyzicola lurida TaxID=1172621 RepID=A0A841AE45_9MICO|nr:polysaccharide pyruvyl transferase family protein [Conyzicola lurida]MBB5842000.1 polysaccharide pyruvyl transferase WcaK-like protein [Conyzicola lurida]